MAYKVFTNGSVLQASEINDNLMRQSVMVFSNAAARTAAITSPVEGMLTWLEDVNRYESYNGSAWVSPFGATLLANVNASGGTVQIQNVFTSEYDNYKILLNLASTANARVQTNLLNGSTVISGNYRVNYEWGTTTRTILGGTSVSDMVLQDTGFGVNAIYNGELNLFSPALVAETAYSYLGLARLPGTAARPDWQTSVGYHGTSASYNGIQFSMGGTMSGTIQVYGMRK